MRLFFLILFLFPSFCFGDSESTIGGKTAQAHIIQNNGTSLRPRPYLNLTGGVTCTDTGGKTVCNITGGGGVGNVGIGTAIPNPQLVWSNNNSLAGVSGSGVDLNGNVGIGSSVPGSKLDVQGSIRAFGNVGIGTVYKDTQALLGIIGDGTDNTNTKQLFSVARGTNFTNAAVTNAFAVAADGNIGIGTFNPTNPIQIFGSKTILSGGGANFGNTLTTSTGNIIDNSSGGYFAVGWTNTSGIFFGGDGNNNSQIWTTGQTSHDINFNTAGTLKMNLVEGNLGIGSTAPSGALDIGTGSICLSHTCNNTWPSGSSQWTTINTNDVYLSNNGNVGIGTTLTTTSALTVMNGNVGIGTWIPAAKLDVQGTLRNAYFAGAVGIGTYTVNGALGGGLSIMNGNVGIGTWNPSTAFAIGTGSGSPTFSVTSSGTTQINANLIVANTFGGGSTNTPLTITSTTSATGTTDSIALRLRNGLLTPVKIQDASGDFGVGIGTLSPGNLLDVEGTVNGKNITFFGSSTGNTGIGLFSPGAKLDVNGTVRMSLGFGISIAQGSNACAGQATLSGGTVTVSTTCSALSTAKGIFLQDATTGALTNIGVPTVGTVVAQTSFVINSSNVLDTSNVNWEIHGTT